jgi:EAL domain-containing protein (putative c-di-GMP-specific phosphodiesterase class I)
MHAMKLPEAAAPRRADGHDRYVAFTFAAAELVAEIDGFGALTYAEGAFRTRFRKPAESFLGQPLHSLVAPADHDALDAALSLLAERGRLPPMMVRMGNEDRTPLALAGVVLPDSGRARRLCLTFTQPPAAGGGRMPHAGAAHRIARMTEARLRNGVACDIGLVEITSQPGQEAASSEAVGLALERVMPLAVANEMSPGRFGLVGPGGNRPDLLAAFGRLETVLRAEGVEVSIAARHLSAAAEGLTTSQAARALRQALNTFAREGIKGVDQVGLGNSLAGYLKGAARKTDSLRQAIRARHFALLFQPIVALNTRGVHHYEALIRPRPIPELALETPQDFVMLVEALGLAEELDLTIAQIACAHATRARVVVAFNLSGQSVQNPGFCDRLIEQLTASPARQAGLAMVEMTETAEIQDVPAATATAGALRAIGVPFCLDDFGAGTTDMRLLRAMNANIVKLDGSYVAGVTEPGRERAFVSGMVDIVRAAGAETVAERIETDAEADALQSLGVQYGQGWLFGRPAPLPDTYAAWR